MNKIKTLLLLLIIQSIAFASDIPYTTFNVDVSNLETKYKLELVDTNDFINFCKKYQKEHSLLYVQKHRTKISAVFSKAYIGDAKYIITHSIEDILKELDGLKKQDYEVLTFFENKLSESESHYCLVLVPNKKLRKFKRDCVKLGITPAEEIETDSEKEEKDDFGDFFGKR